MLPFDRLADDILVVDDRKENQTAIEAALDGFGSHLVFASSGTEALRYLLDRNFALILLDVQMPAMDGIETARMIRARERHRHAPIIFITAYDSSDAQVLEAYKLGAVDFLFKPIDPDVLRAKATVFVELQRRTAEVAHQAQLLKETERKAHERALAEQRRRLEAEALRQTLSKEREHAEVLAKKNGELDMIRMQLESFNRRLGEADRRKDEFIAVLAHELRNPLGALTTALDVLRSDPTNATLTRISGIMDRQCKHLARLVDDLLDISRITSGKLELQLHNVGIGTIIDDALELVALQVEERHHHLEVDCDCREAVIHGDRVRLGQVIANLLSNAARYTDPGGRIDLTARRDKARDQISVSVADNGRGMRAEKIGRVFEMFVQERTGGGGLGIGLPLVRKLTEMHGGDVAAHSDGVGQGSTFTIWLPESVGVVDNVVDDTAIKVGRSLRIALIDDHDDLREMTSRMLARLGHHVTEAACGEDGVALVVRLKPDVAIVDIGLPDIDGFDVARRIRAELGDAAPRLISFSGHSQKRDVALAAGFDDHLSKPANAARLQAAMFAQPESSGT